jgi:hypothetical protein
MPNRDVNEKGGGAGPPRINVNDTVLKVMCFGEGLPREQVPGALLGFHHTEESRDGDFPLRVEPRIAADGAECNNDASMHLLTPATSGAGDRMVSKWIKRLETGGACGSVVLAGT